MRCSSLINCLYGRAGRMLAVIAVAVMLPVMSVQADAIISPVRVMLDDKTKKATVILHNPSEGSRTYRLEWVENRMDEEGAQTAYMEGEQLQHAPASPYLRFSPRRITVQPKVSQTVRIDFRPPADMTPGEYRSHLKFTVDADESEPVSVSDIGNEKGMKIQLAMQLSVSIPVIVRHQPVEPPEVKLASIEIIPPAAPGEMVKMAVLLQRSGATSSYGRLIVEMQRGAGSPVERIAEMSGVNVYAESKQRQLVLNLKDAKLPAGAWLRVAYVGMAEYEGQIFAEQTLQLR